MVSGEKRNNDEEHLMEKITTVLLDIEGTTTSVSFVKDVLFPYAKDHLESYVESHWDEPEFKKDISDLKEQAKSEEEAKIEGFCPIEEGEKEKESLIKNVLWQMTLDRKTTALKQLQGHIWREGYKAGKLKGHVFSDVTSAFKKWCEENRKIFIFSSGSVEAQKLLFGHSEEGDLLEYISGHFDTTFGQKTESNSYSRIIESVGCEKEQILFLTDVVKEAQAARSAGLQTVLVIREGNIPLTDEEKQEFMTITSFNDLVFENSAKRKKLCDVSKEHESGKNSEKEENASVEPTENSHVNGSEEMDVDVTSEEAKTESLETTSNSTDKTEEKTDDETKMDSEDVEIDVVSEDKKEEVSATNSNGDAPQSNDIEKETEVNSANVEKEEDSAKNEESECNHSEPSVEMAVADNGVDPLDITSHENDEQKKEESNSVDNGTLTKDEKAQIGDGTANDKENTIDSEEKYTTEKDEEMTPESGVVTKPDLKEKTSIFTEDKEVNGQSAYNDKSEDAEDGLELNKAVSEDKPEPTVEVNA